MYNKKNTWPYNKKTRVIDVVVVVDGYWRTDFENSWKWNCWLSIIFHAGKYNYATF